MPGNIGAIADAVASLDISIFGEIYAAHLALQATLAERDRLERAQLDHARDPAFGEIGLLRFVNQYAVADLIVDDAIDDHWSVALEFDRRALSTRRPSVFVRAASAVRMAASLSYDAIGGEILNGTDRWGF